MSEPNLHAFLSADAGVAALAAARIFAQIIPEQAQGDPDVYPCATFQLVGTTDGRTMCGDDFVPDGSWQIDAYSPDRDQAVELARAIRRAMVDYSGPMGDCTVQRVLRTASFDIGPDVEPGLYRRSQTFSIWYVET